MDCLDLAKRGQQMLQTMLTTVPGLHGVLLTLHGETVLECYFAPGACDQPHPMYSVSKSITSLAVGMLAGRGQLELDRRASDYLPEWIDDSTPPEARETTLRQLLRMATCHTHRAHHPDRDASWAKAYFTSPAQHAPGGAFGYDSTGTQVLALLCRRAVGMPLLDFLQAELFDKLGATGEKRWLTDPSGVEQGGSGLFMTLRDLSLTANFCLSDGQGIVPKDYLRAAASVQTETGAREAPEERFGYGYQFWLTRQGFAMYGMRGQLAIMLPKENVVLCTTGDTAHVQGIYDAFYDALAAKAWAAGDGEIKTHL